MLEKRFIAIHNFLLNHHKLLSQEVLEHYPHIDSPYLVWVQSLQGLGQEQLIAFENDEWIPDHIPVDFEAFLNQVTELIKLPTQKLESPLCPQKLRKISLKKRHEISRLLPILSKGRGFIDIGSGAGHLSAMLLEQNQKTSLCIDQNSTYQSIGKEKYSHLNQRLKYLEHHFSAASDFQYADKDFLIGLHCCGDLSVELISFFKRSRLKNIVNLGCCYHKGRHFSLSQLARRYPLELTSHALTMAAKSYKRIDSKEFIQRDRVKRFRYTLHFIMQDRLDLSFRTLGNGTAADYAGEFYLYCHKYVPETKSLSINQLTSLWHEYESQYQQFLLYGMIRSKLSRVLEIYIVLDRALALSEHGYQVSLMEIFNRELSPRNIMVHATEA